ncbi:hypothetical protein EDC01DRAFT_700793 [Geopyxis carbonaria]|nr:hypothetical protein EDC01DRAFT_700793 [Geopyxis carbonaria]
MNILRRPLLRTLHGSPLCNPLRASLRQPLNTPLRTLRPRFASTVPPSPPPAPGLGARMKSLSKEYGYSALGVYLFLSALDFPFCFLLVRTVGTERIAAAEEAVLVHVRPVMIAVRDMVGLPPKRYVGDVEEEMGEEGVGEGEQGKKTSIWTELALAYAVHKSLIFLRVPLTAAVTPRVVKVLRGWGWEVGRKGAIREGVKGMRKKGAKKVGEVKERIRD